MLHKSLRRAPAGIIAAAYELPGEPVNVAEFARSEGIGEARIARLRENGVRYFYDGTDRSDASLAISAVQNLVTQIGCDWLKDVGCVIHARTQPFSIPAPPTSIVTEVCDAFDITPKLAFGIEQLACSGVVRAMTWATRLLSVDPSIETVLLVTSDRCFGAGDYRIRQSGGVQCDAGTAVLIGRTNLITQFGPVTRTQFRGLAEGPSSALLEAEIARLTPVQTVESFRAHAKSCAVDLGDFSTYLPINADKMYWEKIAELMGVPISSFFLDNIGRCGHALCGDFAINFIDGGLDDVKAGHSVVYCGQSNLGLYENLALCPPEPSRKAIAIKKATTPNRELESVDA